MLGGELIIIFRFFECEGIVDEICVYVEVEKFVFVICVGFIVVFCDVKDDCVMMFDFFDVMVDCNVFGW